MADSNGNKLGARQNGCLKGNTVGPRATIDVVFRNRDRTSMRRVKTCQEAEKCYNVNEGSG